MDRVLASHRRYRAGSKAGYVMDRRQRRAVLWADVKRCSWRRLQRTRQESSSYKLIDVTVFDSTPRQRLGRGILLEKL